MKYILCLLFTMVAAADTLPPALVKSKTLDGSGNPISSTSGSLNVNVTGGGGTSTVNQGTPNLGGVNAWPVISSQFGTWNVGRTWTLNSGTDSVTIAGSITASNPSVSATGAAVPAQATMVGGSDGTNLRALKTSATGVLSVDGSAVTQPISGSVTANAGTNLNTSLLALESGGNLASINTKVPALGQALAAASVPVVLTAAQLTTLTPLSSVSVSNFPATQPVSGTVTANQGGTWNINNVSGTVSLPTGASTSALQTTGNSSLSSIDSKIPASLTVTSTRLLVDGSGVTQPVSAASLPLPTGAATSALQTTGNASLSSIDSKLTSPLAVSQSGTWNLNNISGTISLPTGAATSTNQTSQITQETTTATNTTSMLANQTNGTQKTQVTVLPADLAPATQNITAQDVASSSTTQANGQPIVTGTPTANSAATFAVASAESVEVEVTGTWTGTLVSEMSFNGTTWFTRGVKLAGLGWIASSFTQNFEGGGNISGTTFYRIRSTAAWTGTATVKAIFTNNATTMTVSTPVTMRDSTTQTITNSIKAASTAALTTDTSLVVALSPNSSTPMFGDKAGSGSINNTGQTVGGAVNGATTCNFTIAGSWVGVLNFTGITNGGAAATLPAYTVNGAPVSLSFFPTTNNTYAVNCAGMSQVFAQFFSYTSGTATIVYNFGAGVNYLQVNTASTATSGSAVPTRSLLVAGSDGTNARNVLTDTTGVVQTSLGNTNKTIKMSSAQLTTTTTTANQVIVTYTVTAGKTFYLQYFDCEVHLTSGAATATSFGNCTLQINGANVYTMMAQGNGQLSIQSQSLSEPLPVAAGQVVQWVTTPSAVTSFGWNANFGGYEK